ncbi:MAG: ion transporter [Thiotrichales bacterium]
MFEIWRQRLDQLKANRGFEFFVVAVILLSAMLVGAHTYDLSPGFLHVLAFFDVFVTLFFLVEISIRFLAEKNKKEFFKSFWNVFDTLIVAVSLIPISNSDVAVLGRLIRIFRVLRLVSIVPELRVLLNSLIKALPQLGYVLLLMFIIFYIYAAAGATLFAHINPDLWGDVIISLLTLFRVMTFEDWTDVMYETMEVYPISWLYYLTFIFFTAFAFLNMVIGIVVNVMEEENAKVRALEHEGEPTIVDLHNEIQELKRLIKESRQ